MESTESLQRKLLLLKYQKSSLINEDSLTSENVKYLKQTVKSCTDIAKKIAALKLLETLKLKKGFITQHQVKEVYNYESICNSQVSNNKQLHIISSNRNHHENSINCKFGGKVNELSIFNLLYEQLESREKIYKQRKNDESLIQNGNSTKSIYEQHNVENMLNSITPHNPAKGNENFNKFHLSYSILNKIVSSKVNEILNNSFEHNNCKSLQKKDNRLKKSPRLYKKNSVKTNQNMAIKGKQSQICQTSVIDNNKTFQQLEADSETQNQLVGKIKDQSQSCTMGENVKTDIQNDLNDCSLGTQDLFESSESCSYNQHLDNSHEQKLIYLSTEEALQKVPSNKANQKRILLVLIMKLSEQTLNAVEKTDLAVTTSNDTANSYEANIESSYENVIPSTRRKVKNWRLSKSLNKQNCSLCCKYDHNFFQKNKIPKVKIFGLQKDQKIKQCEFLQTDISINTRHSDETNSVNKLSNEARLKMYDFIDESESQTSFCKRKDTDLDSKMNKKRNRQSKTIPWKQKIKLKKVKPLKIHISSTTIKQSSLKQRIFTLSATNNKKKIFSSKQLSESRKYDNKCLDVQNNTSQFIPISNQKTSSKFDPSYEEPLLLNPNEITEKELISADSTTGTLKNNSTINHFSELSEIFTEKHSENYYLREKTEIIPILTENEQNDKPPQMECFTDFVEPFKTLDTQSDHENNSPPCLDKYDDRNIDSEIITQCVSPHRDVIEGIEFLSFESESDLHQYLSSIENSSAPFLNLDASDLLEYDNDPLPEDTDGQIILPTKTTDVTKIKGWRHKAFTLDKNMDPQQLLQLHWKTRLRIIQDMINQIHGDQTKYANLINTCGHDKEQLTNLFQEWCSGNYDTVSRELITFEDECEILDYDVEKSQNVDDINVNTIYKGEKLPLPCKNQRYLKPVVVLRKLESIDRKLLIRKPQNARKSFSKYKAELYKMEKKEKIEETQRTAFEYAEDNKLVTAEPKDFEQLDPIIIPECPLQSLDILEDDSSYQNLPPKSKPWPLIDMSTVNKSAKANCNDTSVSNFYEAELEKCVPSVITSNAMNTITQKSSTSPTTSNVSKINPKELNKKDFHIHELLKKPPVIPDKLQKQKAYSLENIYSEMLNSKDMYGDIKQISSNTSQKSSLQNMQSPYFSLPFQNNKQQSVSQFQSPGLYPMPFQVFPTSTMASPYVMVQMQKPSRDCVLLPMQYFATDDKKNSSQSSKLQTENLIKKSEIPQKGFLTHQPIGNKNNFTIDISNTKLQESQQNFSLLHKPVTHSLDSNPVRSSYYVNGLYKNKEYLQSLKNSNYLNRHLASSLNFKKPLSQQHSTIILSNLSHRNNHLYSPECATTGISNTSFQPHFSNVLRPFKHPEDTAYGSLHPPNQSYNLHQYAQAFDKNHFKSIYSKDLYSSSKGSLLDSMIQLEREAKELELLRTKYNDCAKQKPVEKNTSSNCSDSSETDNSITVTHEMALEAATALNPVPELMKDSSSNDVNNKYCPYTSNTFSQPLNLSTKTYDGRSYSPVFINHVANKNASFYISSKTPHWNNEISPTIASAQIQSHTKHDQISNNYGYQPPKAEHPNYELYKQKNSFSSFGSTEENGSGNYLTNPLLRNAYNVNEHDFVATSNFGQTSQRNNTTLELKEKKKFENPKSNSSIAHSDDLYIYSHSYMNASSQLNNATNIRLENLRNQKIEKKCNSTESFNDHLSKDVEGYQGLNSSSYMPVGEYPKYFHSSRKPSLQLPIVIQETTRPLINLENKNSFVMKKNPRHKMDLSTVPCPSFSDINFNLLTSTKNSPACNYSYDGAIIHPKTNEQYYANNEVNITQSEIEMTEVENIQNRECTKLIPNEIDSGEINSGNPDVVLFNNNTTLDSFTESQQDHLNSDGSICEQPAICDDKGRPIVIVKPIDKNENVTEPGLSNLNSKEQIEIENISEPTISEGINKMSSVNVKISVQNSSLSVQTSIQTSQANIQGQQLRVETNFQPINVQTNVETSPKKHVLEKSETHSEQSSNNGQNKTSDTSTHAMTLAQLESKTLESSKNGLSLSGDSTQKNSQAFSINQEPSSEVNTFNLDNNSTFYVEMETVSKNEQNKVSHFMSEDATKTELHSNDAINVSSDKYLNVSDEYGSFQSTFPKVPLIQSTENINNVSGEKKINSSFYQNSHHLSSFNHNYFPNDDKNVCESNLILKETELLDSNFINEKNIHQQISNSESSFTQNCSSPQESIGESSVDLNPRNSRKHSLPYNEISFKNSSLTGIPNSLESFISNEQKFQWEMNIRPTATTSLTENVSNGIHEDAEYSNCKQSSSSIANKHDNFLVKCVNDASPNSNNSLENKSSILETENIIFSPPDRKSILYSPKEMNQRELNNCLEKISKTFTDNQKDKSHLQHFDEIKSVIQSTGKISKEITLTQAKNKPFSRPNYCNVNVHGSPHAESDSVHEILSDDTSLSTSKQKANKIINKSLELSNSFNKLDSSNSDEVFIIDEKSNSSTLHPGCNVENEFTSNSTKINLLPSVIKTLSASHENVAPSDILENPMSSLISNTNTSPLPFQKTTRKRPICLIEPISSTDGDTDLRTKTIILLSHNKMKDRIIKYDNKILTNESNEISSLENISEVSSSSYNRNIFFLPESNESISHPSISDANSVNSQEITITESKNSQADNTKLKSTQIKCLSHSDTKSIKSLDNQHDSQLSENNNSSEQSWNSVYENSLLSHQIDSLSGKEISNSSIFVNLKENLEVSDNENNINKIEEDLSKESLMLENEFINTQNDLVSNNYLSSSEDSNQLEICLISDLNKPHVSSFTDKPHSSIVTEISSSPNQKTTLQTSSEAFLPHSKYIKSMSQGIIKNLGSNHVQSQHLAISNTNKNDLILSIDIKDFNLNIKKCLSSNQNKILLNNFVSSTIQEALPPEMWRALQPQIIKYITNRLLETTPSEIFPCRFLVSQNIIEVTGVKSTVLNLVKLYKEKVNKNSIPHELDKKSTKTTESAMMPIVGYLVPKSALCINSGIPTIKTAIPVYVLAKKNSKKSVLENIIEKGKKVENNEKSDTGNLCNNSFLNKKVHSDLPVIDADEKIMSDKDLKLLQTSETDKQSLRVNVIICNENVVRETSSRNETKNILKRGDCQKAETITTSRHENYQSFKTDKIVFNNKFKPLFPNQGASSKFSSSLEGKNLSIIKTNSRRIVQLCSSNWKKEENHIVDLPQENAQLNVDSDCLKIHTQNINEDLDQISTSNESELCDSYCPNSNTATSNKLDDKEQLALQYNFKSKNTIKSIQNGSDDNDVIIISEQCTVIKTEISDDKNVKESQINSFHDNKILNENCFTPLSSVICSNSRDSSLRPDVHSNNYENSKSDSLFNSFKNELVLPYNNPSSNTKSCETIDEDEDLNVQNDILNDHHSPDEFCNRNKENHVIFSQTMTIEGISSSVNISDSDHKRELSLKDLQENSKQTEDMVSSNLQNKHDFINLKLDSDLITRQNNTIKKYEMKAASKIDDITLSSSQGRKSCITPINRLHQAKNGTISLLVNNPATNKEPTNWQEYKKMMGIERQAKPIKLTENSHFKPNNLTAISLRDVIIPIRRVFTRPEIHTSINQFNEQLLTSNESLENVDSHKNSSDSKQEAYLNISAEIINKKEDLSKFCILSQTSVSESKASSFYAEELTASEDVELCHSFRVSSNSYLMESEHISRDDATLSQNNDFNTKLGLENSQYFIEQIISESSNNEKDTLSVSESTPEVSITSSTNSENDEESLSNNSISKKPRLDLENNIESLNSYSTNRKHRRKSPLRLKPLFPDEQIEDNVTFPEGDNSDLSQNDNTEIENDNFDQIPISERHKEFEKQRRAQQRRLFLRLLKELKEDPKAFDDCPNDPPAKIDILKCALNIINNLKSQRLRLERCKEQVTIKNQKCINRLAFAIKNFPKEKKVKLINYLENKYKGDAFDKIRHQLNRKSSPFR